MHVNIPCQTISKARGVCRHARSPFASCAPHAAELSHMPDVPARSIGLPLRAAAFPATHNPPRKPIREANKANKAHEADTPYMSYTPYTPDTSHRASRPIRAGLAIAHHQSSIIE